MPESYMSRDGFNKLSKELEELTAQKGKLTKDIEEAREKGDLKENAEYHAAKERMGTLMNRVNEIKQQLASARMIDELEIKDGEVQIGVKVSLQDTDSKAEMAWILVGATESDPTAGKISVESPLAQGLLGHKVGEAVTVALPAGEKTFKILKTEAAI
jgi:transcription elongation factor GreA